MILLWSTGMEEMMIFMRRVIFKGMYIMFSAYVCFNCAIFSSEYRNSCLAISRMLVRLPMQNSSKKRITFL